MSEFFPDDEKAPVRFVSPLKNKLIVRSVKGKEKMGRLFVLNLELISDLDNLAFDDVVGQKVTIVLVLDEHNNKERFFNGFITEFKYLGFDGNYITGTTSRSALTAPLKMPLRVPKGSGTFAPRAAGLNHDAVAEQMYLTPFHSMQLPSKCT